MPEKYGGRYEVLGPAGSGGMAQVYRARDELLGREVALKVLNEKLSSDRSFVERFRREAQNAANLNHPNIVSLYDYGADDGSYFIVMEYIDGKSLSEIIREQGPLLPERAAEITADVARGLGRAHENHLVHRDIKPSNIMITTNGQTKVTDFGIARALSSDAEQTMTQTGMVIGTAAYLSPEQAQGNPVDARSDVYSLGCVLYEMLTGAAPFAGDTPLSIAYKHVREQAARPSEVNSDVPEALDAITLKAMSKNPDNRYETAAEMAEDLDRYLAGQRVTATPFLVAETNVQPMDSGTQVMSRTDMYEPYGQEVSRGKGLLYALIALLALGLVGLIVYLLAGDLFAPDVTVPRVVGQNVNEAERTLEDAGLEASIERRPSRKPLDEVFKQDPEEGATVKEGDAVTIFVSEGPKPVEVPRLVGKTEEEARDALEEVDLELGEVTPEGSDEVEAGEVISQFPNAGQEVEPGTAIDLVVSSGPDAVLVPSVIGQTEESATDEIEAAGLVVDPTTTPSDQPEGEVVEQEPAGGTEAQPGDTVRIVVSEGAEQAMPDVRGEDADTAQQQLEDEFGLSVTQQEASPPCTTAPGTVCEQDPAPGTSVSPGDSATLFVQPGGASLEDDLTFAAVLFGFLAS